MTCQICTVDVVVQLCASVVRCCVCGQEQSLSEPAEKQLDIDEDRRNPAYIPRKGYFYEHDLRIDADDPTADDKTE